MQRLQDLGADLICLLLCMVDMIQYSPVCNKTIKEEIRKLQKAAGSSLDRGVDRYICQFGPKALQRQLQPIGQCLCVVQLRMFGGLQNKTAVRKQVPGAQTFCAVQSSTKILCKVQGFLTGGAGFPKLFFLAVQREQAGFYLTEEQSDGGAAAPQLLQCLFQSSLIAFLAAFQTSQLILDTSDVLVQCSYLVDRCFVLDAGRGSLAAFGIQFIVDLPGELVEQGGKAAPLQPVYVLLLGVSGAFQLIQPGLQFLLLRKHIGQHRPQALFFRDLGGKLLQGGGGHRRSLLSEEIIFSLLYCTLFMSTRWGAGLLWGEI